MIPAQSFLDLLKAAAERSAEAEDEFRRQIGARTRELERQRAFAFRRLNLMKDISGVIAGAESKEIAVAAAAAVLRAKLGWASDSDARIEVVSRFAPVAQAAFAHLSPAEDDEGGPEKSQPDVMATLADFETWYEATHPNPFWVLFENVMPETPVVDF
jgi:hypothetical protein